MQALYQEMKANLIQGHQNVFLLVLKGGTKGYILLNIQSKEIFVYRDVVSMNMFFHIKRLRILEIKLTIQAFMIKVLLQKINLF